MVRQVGVICRCCCKMCRKRRVRVANCQMKQASSDSSSYAAAIV